MSEPKNMPKKTDFKQQTLTGFQPIYSSKSVSLIFFSASLLFYVFGFPLYVLSESVVEVSKRYDDDCKIGEKCTITLEVDKKITEPVYIYYQLHNYYQNHRLYVRSRSYTQLHNGKDVKAELDRCAPAKYNKDFKGYGDVNRYGELDPDEVAVPCGMIARSVFNDTFSFGRYEEYVDHDDIVYESDKKIWINGDKKKQWRDIDDNLRVWMKISLFSNFRKLWGKITKDVEKGKLTVTVQNNYDVDEWNGEKRLVLSNASAFGGKNSALGIIFIVAGSLCMLSSLIFILLSLIYKPKISDDPHSWKY